MGAWGYGIFEDDTACDFVYEVEDSDDPKTVFADAFETAINSDYLEYDGGCAALVSAAYIDAILNGTEYETDENVFKPFVEKNKNLPVPGLKKKAVKAVKKVLAENSELNELWEENEELYPKWKQSLNELIERLQGTSK